MGTADIAQPSGPGKTSPRLLADLYEFDLARPSTNSLIEFPAQCHGSNSSSSYFPPAKHTHILSLKPEQSELMEHTVQDLETRYAVATVCRDCRTHINVSISYPRGLGTELCGQGNEHYPLHHFQYQKPHSTLLQGKDARGLRDLEDRREFRCSSPSCAAQLVITSRPPMLDPSDIKLMSDRSLLQERAKLVNQKFPSDKGESLPSSPGDALRLMYTYLHNFSQDHSQPIPRENRHLLRKMGYDADIIFQKAHLEMTRTDENPAGVWKRPTLTEETSPDFTDLLTELKILACSPQFRESGIQYNPISAEKELQRLLVCEKYPTNSAGRSLTPFTPSYANLGAVGDFSDNLLFWCYARQTDVDPSNAPFYLECLMDLATGRNSEDLQIGVAKYRSEGRFSTSDVRDAYRALNLEPDVEYEEDVIVGKFRVFVSDSPRSEPQMRQALLMIGKARNSEAIIQAATKVVMDVAQAYQYFEATEETEPSFLISLYHIKIKDQPNEKSVARDALRLIANKLSSTILTEFLDSGNIYDQPLDVGMAYSRLECPEDIADETLIVLYNIRVTDGSNNNKDYREALRIIGESRNSDIIRNFLQTGETTTGGRSDWPVGLENIGNTCYLNSLLQFYFTIKPLREMILQFDSYQEDENEELLQTKRVGGRKVTVTEVQRAKTFVRLLRELFRKMISSKDASVTPEYDLARLALEPFKKDEKKRMSTDGLPPVITLDDGLDTKMDDDDNKDAQTMDDAGSEITLVEKLDAKANDEDFVMIDSDKKDHVSLEDKENFPPKANSTTLGGGRPVLQDIDMNGPLPNREEVVEPQAPPTPPPDTLDQPPPVPPRPNPKPAEKDLSVFGRQQDVAECSENIMFQIETAVKPEGHDDNGEQVDLVKKLFYGKTKQSLKVVGSKESRSKIELFSHLLIDVADGSRDIYSALDSVFDVTTVNLEGKDTMRYLSISELPPILQLQVQRVQFDRKSGKAYKSTAHLKFPETIYMDRYLDSADPLLQAKREEAWEWKTEITALEKQKMGLTNKSIDLDAPDTLNALQVWVKEISDSEDKDLLDENTLPAILEGLDQGIRNSTQELNEINEQLKELKAKAAAQFEGLHHHAYRIHSVFIHRGTASFGHYWIYIYDFKEKIWRKYNDEHVDRVDDLKQVFGQEGSNPATPYFLVFVKDEETNSGIVESVERKLE